MLRAQLPALDQDEPVVVVGPSYMLSHFIGSAARTAVDKLAELVRTPARSDRDAEAALRAARTAADAWLETYMDCEALEWYTFDPPFDPADPIL